MIKAIAQMGADTTRMGPPEAASGCAGSHPGAPHADAAALSLQSGTSLAMALVSRHCPEAFPGTGQVGRRPSAESASSVVPLLILNGWG